MKFELGLEKKIRDDKKMNSEKLDSLEAYEDFNHETVDELLEKRRKEGATFDQRQNERIKKLKELENDGILYIEK